MASSYMSGYKMATSGSSDSTDLQDLVVCGVEEDDDELDQDDLEHEGLCGEDDVHIEEVEVEGMPVEIIDDTVGCQYSPTHRKSWLVYRTYSTVTVLSFFTQLMHWLLFRMGHTHVAYTNLYISVPLTILMLNLLTPKKYSQMFSN